LRRSKRKCLEEGVLLVPNDKDTKGKLLYEKNIEVEKTKIRKTFDKKRELEIT
jgi:hypothetical protein